MIGFVTTSLSYTALADEKPEIRQKKSSANKNNLQVQRKTTRQSNTKARKIEPSRQQRLDQARQKRRRSREQDPTDRFFRFEVQRFYGSAAVQASRYSFEFHT